MASIGNTLYQTIAKRNSIYVTSIFAAAFAFSVGYDQATSAFYDHWNKGKQWKDIRHKFASGDDEE